MRGSDGLGLSPGRGTVFLDKILYSHSPLSTQVYKWVPANLLLGVTLRWTSIPIQGGVAILLVASCYGNRDKLRLDGPLGSYTDFFYVTNVLPSGRLDMSFISLLSKPPFHLSFIHIYQLDILSLADGRTCVT